MVEFVAQKVAATSGDARKMFEVVTNAIVACRNQLSTEELSHKILGDQSEPILVKLPHAMAAIRLSILQFTPLIESLPTYEKAALCAGVNLARAMGSKILSLGRLREFTLMLLGMNAYSDDFIQMEDFKGIVERLVDRDLIRLHDIDLLSSSLSMARLSLVPIKFDLQLEDVESALESSLKTNPMYKRMAIKINTIDFTN
jgi:Cdc6-like AAA superfamily ATPase